MELLQKARELYRSGEIHDALEVAQAACERQPRNGEAWWLLGCISRHAAMPAASDDAFRRAADLTRRRMAPVRTSRAEFEAIVAEARLSVSADARRRLGRTRVAIAELPERAAISAGLSPDALVLRTRQEEDVLTLFKVNFENRCGSSEELAKLVGRTLAKA